VAVNVFPSIEALQLSVCIDGTVDVMESNGRITVTTNNFDARFPFPLSVKICIILHGEVEGRRKVFQRVLFAFAVQNP